MIENCWAVLDNNLRGKRPRSFKGYKNALQEAWSGVGLDTINKLVASFPQRCEDCIKRDGAWPRRGAHLP